MRILREFSRAALLLSALVAVPIGAQEGDSATTRAVVTTEPQGLTGFVIGGATGLTMAGRDMGNRGMGGLRLGWRFGLPGGIAPRVRFGPEVSFAITDVGGLDTTSADSYAFSQLGAGAQVSVRILHRLRVYGSGRIGKYTTELIDVDDRLWNYSGTGSSIGGGVEVPITPVGRGLDLGLTYARGRFTRGERLRNDRDTDVRFRAWAFHAGWGGPVTIGLPWQ